MCKILILVNDLHIGGIQKSLIEFLNYLSKRNLKIDLIVWEANGVLEKEIPGSVNVIYYQYPKTWKAVKDEKKIFKKILAFKELLTFKFFDKIIKKPWLFFPKIKEEYQKVICYNQDGYSRFYAVDNVLYGEKFLWFHHGSYEFSKREYALDQKYFNKFRNVITVSEANKKMLSEHFPLHINRFHVIPNIINAEKIIEDSLSEVADLKKAVETKTFITVSRFSKEKGIHLAIEVADELKNRGLKFKWYFIGDGDIFSEIEKIIQQKNLSSECVLLGMKKNPYPYIKQADLYIQTSLVESQSITIHEALVLKKLIVTTNLPALTEALQNGKLGVLCEKNKESFVRQIMNLLENQKAQDTLKLSVDEYVVSNEKAYRAIDKLF
ncbi:glycosyltransferase [Halpernia frigidisoli]|uniref:Glycosyltransferase involved in cell wall bisynthesis n=1 Tax=Halpernia frigidisoli TaxID=1125876 RepID=A0A1I3FEI3_9FLAO|nr:glycosyltransferase [Halpernia frigidisoli]SFI09606.1 Glycosyltransferase involved in cell wall bisynthesis [Halpernia frigidisoli]